MSYIGSANLIDLSLEGEIPCSNTQDKTECDALPPKDITEPFLLTQSWPRSDSLANNPFDSVQDIVNREDDPFDSIAKQAYLKAQLDSHLQTEVKVANLLNISNDNILDGETPAMALEVKGKITENKLNLESTPVNTNGKLLQDSESDCSTQSSAENSGSAKLKSGGEYRKRLLKLSISNAAFNSPVTHKNTSDSEDNFGTPVSTVLSRAAEFGENLLASESPLKLVDDDMAESLIDSEKNFEADLEMLRIPMLNDLPSPAIQTLTGNTNSPELSACKTPTLENTLPSLEAIKAKLKAKKDERDNNHQQEIVSLIQNLKHLITSGDIIDENKKQQAGVLLESLSSALKPSTPKENLQVPQEPQPVQRQGTFDIELQKNEEIQPEGQPLAQETDTCMISSSGTYDGETTDEKKDLNLPEIAELSPINEPHQNDCPPNSNANLQNPSQTDVNNIVDQLSRLLIGNSADSSQNIQNPTVIVVMNSNPVNQSINSTQSSLDAKQRSAFVASYLENSINDGSPDLTKVNPMPRRRSQSLSIYDNVKIVRLPLPLPSPRSMQNDNNMQLDNSQSVATIPPTADRESPEFQTPARMVRRNSYSSGTPYTAQVGLRRTSLVSDGKNSSIQLRKGQSLETHHERQQQRPLVRPIPIPSNNMSAFKPDLKKKCKQNTESIIKSSGPLKATMPMKKYAPTLKTSPPTPDGSKTSSSLHTQPKNGRLPSTPKTVKESSSLLVPGVGYPNACSTPAAITTPLKHPRGSISKPRYSYMSTTPNAAKSVSTSVGSANLKRRTITEFKAKSPLRPRVSSVGVASAVTATAATSSRIGTSRLSTSAGARIVKTPAKSTVTNTATLRPTENLGSRASVGGTGLSTRNKENKRP